MSILFTSCGTEPSGGKAQSLEISEPLVLDTLAPTRIILHKPTSTATLTPESTQTAIPTPTPTSTLPWGDFLGPTDDSEMGIPPPVAPIKFPEDAVNILLLGRIEGLRGNIIKRMPW